MSRPKEAQTTPSVILRNLLGREPGRDLRAEELERVTREREARGINGIEGEISDRLYRFQEMYAGNVPIGFHGEH